MAISNIDKSRYCLVAFLALLAIVSQVAHNVGLVELALDRDWLAQRQWWQPLTGHWVHGNAVHLLLNLLALAIISELFADEVPGLDIAGHLLVLVVGVGLILPFFMKTQWYLGLSGVLHGLFVIGAWRVLQRRRGFGLLLLAALGVKLLAEQVMPSSGLSARWINMPIATESHRVGAAVGAALAMLGQLQRVVVSAIVRKD